MLKCSVCGSEGYDITVASSPFGGFSLAYCPICRSAMREPYYSCVMIADICGGYHKLAPWAKTIVDNSLAFYGITTEQFNIDVQCSIMDDGPSARVTNSRKINEKNREGKLPWED